MDDYNIVGLFCEDIREEVGGKHTIVGVYSDNVIVNNIPGAFSKLGIYVRVHLSPAFVVREMSLSLRFPSGEENEIGIFDIAAIEALRAKKLDEPSVYVGLLLQAVATPVPVTAIGRFMAIIKMNGEEHIAAALNVKLKGSDSAATPSPTAAAQPV